MRQTDDITKKSRMRKYLFAYCFIMIIIAVASFYTAVCVLSEKMKTQNEHLIESYSDKTAVLIRDRIEDMGNFLGYMDFCISNDVDYRTIQAVRTMYEDLELADLWVIGTDGEVYSYRHQAVTDADGALLERIMSGDETVFTEFVQGKFYTYAVRKIQKADGEEGQTVVLVDRTDILQKYISDDLEISGEIEQCVIDDFGRVYYSSMNLKEKHSDILSLLKSDQESQTLVDRVREVLEADQDQKLIYYTTDQEKLAYAERIDDRDLYLLTIVPTSALTDQARNHIFIVLQIALTGLTVFAALSAVYFLLVNKEHFREVRHITYHDPITDDMNYLRFKEKAAAQIPSGKRMFLLLNIKKFKIYNDIFGFEEGDRLLKNIHQILKQHCGRQELLCRAHSDHFCMLWEDRGKEENRKRLDALMDDLENLGNQNRKFKTEFSLGVSFTGNFNEQNPSTDVIDALYSEAAIACQHRGSESGSTLCEYHSSLRYDYLEQKLLQDRLLKALEEENFEVWYQPKYDLEQGAYVSCEALARPGKEISDLSTGTFIGFFEEGGWIGRFDLMIFEKVCQDIRRWKDGGRQVLPVSLNLSRENTYDLRFVDTCLGLLEKYGISHNLIQFEITETRQMLENHHLGTLCGYLHRQGFVILLDDFGVGYSSISTLVDIPFDILKLDISLVRKIGTEEGEKILKSLILLAGSLDKKLIAEGVETAEQENFLKGQGVYVMQGYRYRKAMGPVAYQELLKRK